MTTEPVLHIHAASLDEDWTPIRFDGFQFLIRILRQCKLIAVCTVLAALLSLAYALTRKPFFAVEASFLLPSCDRASSRTGARSSCHHCKLQCSSASLSAISYPLV